MADKKIELNVILVSFEYPPRRLSKVSDVVHKVASYLAKNNVNIWIITFDDWRSDVEKLKNITVIRIPNNVPNNISHLSAIVNLKPGYQSAISALLHEEDIGLLHFFEWQTLPLLIPWAGKLPQKIVYSTSSIQNTRDKEENSINGAIKKIEEISQTLVDLILVDSKELNNKIIEEYGVKSEKIKVIPYKDRKITDKIYTEYMSLLTDG